MPAWEPATADRVRDRLSGFKSVAKQLSLSRQTQLAELDACSWPVFGATIPHAAEFSRINFAERWIGVLDPGIIKRFLIAPLAGGRLHFIAQRCTTPMWKPRRLLTLGGTVIVNVDMRAVAGPPKEAL